MRHVLKAAAYYVFASFALIKPAVSAHDSNPVDTRSWFKIVTQDDVLIGHGWNEVQVRDGVRSVVQYQMMKTREHRHKTRTVTETVKRVFSSDGQIRSIERISKIDKEQNILRVFIVDGHKAEVERIGRSGSRRMAIALPTETQFDGGDALLAQWDFDLNPKLVFPSFSLLALAVERVEIVRAAVGNAAGQSGRGGNSFYRYSYDGPYLRAASYVTRTNDGRLALARQQLFGTSVSFIPTNREDAEKNVPAFSPLQTGRIQSPYKIGQAALSGHIRYRFRFKNTPFALPQTGEQRSRIDGDEMIVDICAECGQPQRLSDEERIDALQPTLWLQHDHPRLQKIAAVVKNKNMTDAQKMSRLAIEARKSLPIVDFAGHYSAADALARKRGDCSEDAVVLAALGRAVGIPTRVVSGLVYARARYHGIAHSFLPHTWTIAWIDGRWQSFDMSLGQFDSTHIVFSLGNGDPRAISASDQLAGMVDWVSMVEVKKREAKPNTNPHVSWLSRLGINPPS